MSAARARALDAFARSAALAVVALLSVGPVVDPDLGFHLATGRAVLSSGAIPATNVLSFAAPDALAVNQQWLPAVLLELVWRAAGPGGVVATRVLVLLLTYAAVAATLRVLGARGPATLVAVTLAASAAAFRFVDRPLLFSNLTSAFVVLGLGLASTGRRRAGLGLVAAGSFAGPQLHAGAVFGMFAVVAWAAAEVAGVLARRARGASGGDAAALRRALEPALAMLAGVGAALLSLLAYHPHALRVLAVPFQMADDPYLHEHLVEYRVPWDQPLALLAPYWLFLGAVVLAVARRARDRRAGEARLALPLGALAVAALGLGASLAYARFADLAALFAAPALGVALEGGRGARAPERPGGAPRPRADLAGFALLAVGALALRLGVVPPAPPELSPVTWPLALDAFARREALVGPAFVQDGWAGPYLGLRYPEERVFFHPAFDAYPRDFYRDPYTTTRDGEPGWEATLERFGVELVWMKHTSERERARQGGRPNLRQRLSASPSWALVAFDDLGAIWVRRAGPNAAAAERLAITGVDPDRLELAAAPEVARASLEAFRARGLPSRRLELLLARAAAP